MKLVIRLVNHGKKNHERWWIILQRWNQNIKGRYMEKLGDWLPRKTKTVDRAIIVNRPRIAHWIGVFI